jgi:hypothetical protein
MKHQHILPCCVLLFFTSCYFPSETYLVVGHYPLATGNQWHYIRQLSIFNFRPSGADTTSPETTITFTTDVNMLGQVLVNGSEAWKVQTIEHEDGQTFTGYDFYSQIHDSLRLIAYTTPTVPIEPVQKYRYHANFSYQGFSSPSFTELLRHIEGYRQAGMNVSSDSLYYEEGPVTSFVFPVRFMSAWDYRLPDYFPGWLMRKKVIGTSVIQVNNFLYPTYKIQWYWDTNRSGSWNPNLDGYEYLSSSGLLRRELILKNFVMTSPQSPEDTLGLFDYKEDYVVQTMSVH